MDPASFKAKRSRYEIGSPVVSDGIVAPYAEPIQSVELVPSFPVCATDETA